MRSIRKYAVATALASLILAASAAHAHIPAECAVRVQELGWALEGHDDTEDNVIFSRDLMETDLAVDGKYNLDRAERHIRQLDVFINVLESVRSKALLLFSCITEPPTGYSLPDE